MSGYESLDLVENLETIWVVLVISVMLIALLPFLWILAIKSDFFKKAFTSVYRLFFWNGIIRLIIEVSLELSISSILFLQFYDRHPQTGLIPKDFSIQQIISLFLSCIFLVSLIILPIFSACFLTKNYKRILMLEEVKSEEYKELTIRLGSLYEGMDMRRLGSRLYLPVFITRRIIIGVALVFMTEYPLFQVFVFFATGISMMIFQGLYKPWLERSHN